MSNYRLQTEITGIRVRQVDNSLHLASALATGIQSHSLKHLDAGMSVLLPIDPLEQALRDAGLVEQPTYLSVDIDATKLHAGEPLILSFEHDGNEPQFFVSDFGTHKTVEVSQPHSVLPNVQTFSLKFTRGSGLTPSNNLLGLSAAKSGLLNFPVKVFKFVGNLFQHATDKITGAIATYIEKKEKPQERLLQFTVANGSPLQPIAPTALAAFVGQRNLLLVHGIFSSIDGAFTDLRGDTAFLQMLSSRYANRVIGFDHWTVSEGPATNAKVLADMLPANSTFDILLHSRGAMVARHLLENPSIRSILNNKKIVIERVVFVGGAYGGDPLASTNNPVLNIAKAFSAVAQLVSNPILVGLGVAVKVLVAVAHGVQKMPGIAGLDPTKINFKIFNQTSDITYHPSWSRYEYAGVLSGVSDAAIRTALGALNDLVIPDISASLENAKAHVAAAQIISNDGKPQGKVHHLNYFDRTVRGDTVDYAIRSLS